MGGTVGWDPASGPSVNGAKIDTTGMKNVGGKWYGSNQNIMGQLATVKAPDYVNPNQTDMDALVKKILNPEAFAYDPTTDPAYQSLLSRYTQEGDRAFANTMVDLNANTGGELNSWAVSGASNARNDMVSQAQDSIPALMQAAYGMYSDKQNQTYKQFDALNGLDSTSYNRFRDTTGDFQTNVKNALGLMDTADATTRDTRNFNRDVAVSDRNFTQDVAVSDRNFAQDVKTSDRNYALAVRAENRIGRKSASGSSEKNTDITKLGTQPQIGAYYQFLDIFSGGGNGTYKGNAAAAYSRLIGKRGEIEKQIGSKLYKQLVSDVKGIDTVVGQPAAAKSSEPVAISKDPVVGRAADMMDAVKEDNQGGTNVKVPKYTNDEIAKYVAANISDYDLFVQAMNYLGINAP